MDTRNAFILPPADYDRDLNFIEGTIDDNALYISLMTKDPLADCKAFVKQVLAPDGEYALHNPKATYLDKNTHGDRELKIGTLMGFIKRVENQNLLLSPSMTAYMPESVRQSTHAQYIEEGVNNRSKVKGEMFDAERAIGDPKNTPLDIARLKDTVIFKKGAQNNLKINNNSYSGGTVSTATILHYKSTHSSLTSTCRAATSYANAANEKFIRGNRHYYTPEIVKANFVSTINLSDLSAVENTCIQFGLAYPTTEQVMSMVVESTEYYWQDKIELSLISELVDNMSPVQRAAVMYVGDMYHLYNLNKVVIRTFLDKLASLGTPGPDDITDAELKQVDGDTLLLANFLCFQQVQGRKLSAIKEANPEEYKIILATVGNILTTLRQYEPIIRTFFLTTCLPSSIHAFPAIRRKAVPLSDTDSTMFTLMWWIEEFYGKIVFTPEARRLVFAMVFLISESVMHILAILSRNMGVSDNKLRLLAMKNEYYFEVLCLTTRSKHYFASRDAQEGLMKRVPEMEIKGVGLRDSKVPPKIQRQAKKMMEHIVNEIKAGNQLQMRVILKQVADIERNIYESLDSGKFEYLTTAQVKPADSYKSDENATFKQYGLWQEVFAPSFGECQPPPYQAVKLSLATNNRTELEAWYERMNNAPLANRLKTYLMREGRRDLNTLIIPFSIVESSGIPPEITCAIDKRRVISNVMGAFYIVLESLGIFLIEKNNIRLVSDYY